MGSWGDSLDKIEGIKLGIKTIETASTAVSQNKNVTLIYTLIILSRGLLLLGKPLTTE